MNGKGIEIFYKNGETQCFDPISEWFEDDLSYSFWIGGYDYQIPKEDVLKLREYDLCEDCGYEVYYDGCRNCYLKEEI